MAVLNEPPCLVNNTCLDENQYCRGYFNKRCVCQAGYRMNETTGMCEDINECRERLVCDHYCINTLGSYRCACQEHYQLKADKHTCVLQTNQYSSGEYAFQQTKKTTRDDLLSATLVGLFDDGVYRINFTTEHELPKNKEWGTNKTLLMLLNHAYLIDHDPVDNYLYFTECTTPIRPVIMSCPKTRGIFRINLSNSVLKKEVHEIFYSIVVSNR